MNFHLLLKIWAKNTSKNLIKKYRQRCFDHAKQSATDVFKTTSEKMTQKRAEATGDLIGNRTLEKVTQNSPRSNSQKEESIEMPKERYTSPEKRQQIIDDLRLK